MYISILGSWNKKKEKDWQVKAYEKFVEACNALGRGIVNSRHMLVVDEDATKNTATWHTFTGLCEAVKSSKEPIHPCVVLIDPYKNGSRYQKFLNRYKSLAIKKESCLRGRERRRTFQLILSDAVVFLGGAASTYSLGRSACAGRSNHVVCVGSFGGAAAKLLEEQIGDCSTAERERLHLWTKDWDEQLENELVDVLGLKNTKNFLIIHGRGADEYKLQSILQNDLGLPKPAIMKDMRGAGSSTLPEKFETIAATVHAAIAVVTADDIGGLLERKGPIGLNYRARQNVWLEIGWFWGRLGRQRILLLCKGETEIPSDLSGIEVSYYKEDPSECLKAIAEFVQNVGRPPSYRKALSNLDGGVGKSAVAIARRG
jgi:predicted nucleotide-binding protein